MPRKTKKKAETAAEDLPALPREPDEPELKASLEIATETGTEVSAPDATAIVSDEAHAEAIAEAADTFDQAYEDRVPQERPAQVPADLAEGPQAATPEHAGPPEPEPAAEFASAERPPAHLERLQKILSQAGVASRRHAEEMIVEGRVQVNGQVVTELGSKADPDRDHIRVDGKLLSGAERLRYFVLNKPRGYVTTVSDPEGRPTVMQFFKKMHERLYPVGRLDYHSEGLLLVTNDGELANKLTRPASGVERTYLVKVSGQPAPDALARLRSGLAIDRGRRGEGRVQTSPADIREFRQGDNPWFEVVLTEGRNRELRKMFEEVGHHVEKIRRVGYGPLVLDLEPGKLRELEPEELARLRLAADGKWRKPKEREAKPKEFQRRRPAEQARPQQQKPPDQPREWRRESRGEWRPNPKRAESRPPSDRKAPSMRPPRPGLGPKPGGARKGPGREFGERREYAPRESRPPSDRKTPSVRPPRPGQGPKPGGVPKGPGREFGERREYAPRESRPPSDRKAPSTRPPRPGQGPKPGGVPKGPGREFGERREYAPRESRPPRQDAVGSRQRRTDRPAFEPRRGDWRGSPKPAGNRPVSRTNGRKPDGPRPDKFRPAMSRARPAAGGTARGPQRPPKRGPSSPPGPGRHPGSRQR